MKRRDRIVLGAMGALGLFGAAVMAHVFVVGPYRAAQRDRVQEESLLQRTDHAALLAACRELMRRDMRAPRGAAFTTYGGDDSRVPEAVRALRPTRIEVSGDHVRVELGGGFHHFGLDAFAEGVGEADVAAAFAQGGRRRLTQGLWYYSD